MTDTVSQCSAKAVSVGSSQLNAMYSSAANNGLLVVACIAAVAVVASVLLAKKADGYVSMEDGYARLADDTRYA
ncbi:hypothetical protein SDRG_02635 [Saprolegnia diclina VS20]|uniref:Uncharacterized protein n=1 Tax=Saprolegnia diclina (strain VS20) TaxID=1156394 RepID=T0R129_SAPDV|nr:hypothetical protein SDRG_02635 [Saprolegnia diclina VS20]XP_008611077.1 hypothetical protein SDRG_07038 [Saprolegnia diclina VS20]EQC35327.1 hypothetical protein SDRG_07038 [Saprolegnia diclina VS20]EQC39980.1 hypothetical protein SDRG_02635 [Saprolegnia diclina VS20]|eukprot:XP_008606454.1 hypothetical protein SDRG_02635 [Saprolegnia diclina VS20]